MEVRLICSKNPSKRQPGKEATGATQSLSPEIHHDVRIPRRQRRQITHIVEPKASKKEIRLWISQLFLVQHANRSENVILGPNQSG